MSTSSTPGSDGEVRLQAIIDWLENGRITTDQAAARVRTLHFPAPEDKSVTQQRQADATGDPDVPEPGSFFAISTAFAAGRIDRAQYEALAKAAALAMKPVPGT